MNIETKERVSVTWYCCIFCTMIFNFFPYIHLRVPRINIKIKDIDSRIYYKIGSHKSSCEKRVTDFAHTQISILFIHMQIIKFYTASRRKKKFLNWFLPSVVCYWCYPFCTRARQHHTARAVSHSKHLLLVCVLCAVCTYASTCMSCASHLMWHLMNLFV